VGQLSQRPEASESSDWTELERGFFAAAPPDVAVQPAPPPSFDDLGPVEPTRSRRRKAAVARSAGRWAAATARARRGARHLFGAARRLAPSVGATARRLGPSARATIERRIHALAERLAVELPERPDGKTIAGALAALVIVFGVSASVLGSRSAVRVAAAAVAPAPAHVALAAPPEAQPLPEAAPAPALTPAPAPAPAPALAPAPATRASTPTASAPKAHVGAKRHHAKRHAAHGVASHRANVFVH